MAEGPLECEEVGRRWYVLPNDGVDLKRVDVVDASAFHASSGDVCVVCEEFGVVAYAFAYDVGGVVVREDVEVFGGPFA